VHNGFLQGAEGSSTALDFAPPDRSLDACTLIFSCLTGVTLSVSPIKGTPNTSAVFGFKDSPQLFSPHATADAVTSFICPFPPVPTALRAVRTVRTSPSLVVLFSPHLFFGSVPSHLCWSSGLGLSLKWSFPAFHYILVSSLWWFRPPTRRTLRFRFGL